MKLPNLLVLLLRSLLGLLALCHVGVLIWNWGFREAQRQDKFLLTAGLGLGGYALFLLWVLFLSRWSSRARWTIFGGTVAVGIFCGACLRITGVTGDLLPIVGWRWSKTVAGGAAPSVSLLPPTNAPASLTNRFPQFLGPNRDGILSGPNLATNWSQEPPRELWRRPMGSAWSGFAVEGPWAVTQEQQGELEQVACYELLTGREVWRRSDPSRYATTIAGEGPRATPTLRDGRVYSLGGAGLLNCLDLLSGRVLWATNTLAGSGAKVPEWGVACSPLVTDRAVIITVGGRNQTLVAYDRLTGQRLWAAGSDDAHWSSPVQAVLGGVPQILTFNDSLAAHDELTGRVLWQSPWGGVYPRVSLPLVLEGDRVLLSTGYGQGAELLQVTRDESGRWRARRVWKSIRMKSKFGTLLPLNGVLYGLDDGALACVDLASGELKWKGDRFGHGQMLLVGGLILMAAESGEIVLLQPDPNEQRELARFKVFTNKMWNPPALVGDLLLVRNDREAVCLRLPLQR